MEPLWVGLTRRNLRHALPPDRQRLARIVPGDARRLPVLLQSVAGRIDLVVVSPPYACDAGTIGKPAWLSGRTLCDARTLNYSRNKSNVGHARGESHLASMAEIYSACHEVLRPAGVLVTVTKNTRRAGCLFDLAGTTVALARCAGFVYLQHVVALLAAVRDGQLVARPSFWQLTQIRKARARGEPAHLVVHEDVCVFAKPGLRR